ncbi:hypothetical protein BK126_21560 [Paenibacillus sp. FSL H7-0326]|uniref:transglutaminase-like domain-containing protein n=1 Tax=Paenibacillus sp. FSL H7-0326 TaxID=1921144 RepID=UPI00096E90DE|nr:transglutaminase-like domain-containing protein [Paenibacillus sp. FSL H7-0326]OMC65305.1 hypothetical protein BK126_21560 [Paenibacillus sp. FSL H7-0326]
MYDRNRLEQKEVGSAVTAAQAAAFHEPWYFRAVASIALFIMFLEWLRPGGISGDLWSPSSISLMVMTFLLLLIGTWNMSLGKSLMIRCVLSFAGLWWMVKEVSGADWMLHYPLILRQDIFIWLNRDGFWLISDQTKTILVALGWSLFVSAVQILVIQLRTVLLFGVVTSLYIFGVELVNGENTTGAMIRIISCFLFLQTLMQLPKLNSMSFSVRGKDKHRYLLWIGIAMGSVLLAGGAAAVSSVLPAKSPDLNALANTRDRLINWAEGLQSPPSEAALARTGYDNGGSEMGAPLVANNEVFFTAYSPVATYWRGQSRSIYDGRSWKSEYNDAESKHYISTSGRIREDEIEENPYFRLIQQTVELQTPAQGGADIFTGGVPVRLTLHPSENVDALQNEKGITGQNKGNQQFPYIVSDYVSGNLRFDDMYSSGYKSVTSYSADVLIPVDDLSSLSTVTGSDPAEIKRMNLQLPEALPVRVRELAANITDGSTNRYDAVTKVASYLRSNYSYSLDTRVPPSGKDFVDDFLFITKKGYCNHFSTAMVVLLRSQGIPARYVQGFGPGERSDPESNEYTVTHGDAHAWAEVYFPGVGWIPFEATPGYSTEELVAAGAAETDETVPSEQHNVISMVVQKIASSLKSGLTSIMQPLTLSVAAACALLLAAAVQAGRSYSPAIRLRLMLSWPPSPAFPDRERLLRVGAPVWERIAQKYGVREQGVTLREYTAALPLSGTPVHDDVRQFAADWEKLVYASVPFSRSSSVAFLNRCLRISRSLK